VVVDNCGTVSYEGTWRTTEGRIQGGSRVPVEKAFIGGRSVVRSPSDTSVRGRGEDDQKGSEKGMKVRAETTKKRYSKDRRSGGMGDQV